MCYGLLSDVSERTRLRPSALKMRLHTRYCTVRRTFLLFGCFLLILCHGGPQTVDALIHELRVSGDNRKAFHIESFGFVEGGVADLAVKSFGIWPIPSATSSWKMGFVFRKVDSESDAVASIDEVRCCFYRLMSPRSLHSVLRLRIRFIGPPPLYLPL